MIERPLPAIAWGRAAPIALLAFALLLGGWEWRWRAYGVTPSYRNSDGLWAMQRRKVDADGGRAIIVGSSRAYFDIQLDVWERLAGERPIQLAKEGTPPLPYLEDLAADPDVTGTVFVGYTPALYFGERLGAGNTGPIERYRDERPSQWLGQRLSMLLEPALAFYDPDFALFKVIHRGPWPAREGVRDMMRVRKVANFGPDRNARTWSKLDDDPAYAENQTRIWSQFFPRPLEAHEPARRERLIEFHEQVIERTVRAVEQIRARGGEVIFLRLPSRGPFRETENRTRPREQYWDRLIERADVLGIHFEDHPSLQGFSLPEWSHISGRDADAFTAALFHIVQRERFDHADLEQADRPAIVFLGDSLTAGLGLSRAQAVPARIQERIDDADLDYRVINAGRAGDTSAGGLVRLPRYLRPEVGLDVLVINLGSNDAMRGLPLAELESNLRAIAERTRDERPSARIFVAQLEAIPNRGPDYAQAFREVFPRVAETTGATLLPFPLAGVAGVAELNQPDGIHPNAEGAARMADNIWRALKPHM